MAHYKRKKCRYNGKGRQSSTTFYRKRHGLKPYKDLWHRSHKWGTLEYLQESQAFHKLWPAEFNMMGNWPRSWDILYHTRPRRAAEKRLARAIVKNRLDPDDIAWPLEKKPHIYYW